MKKIGVLLVFLLLASCHQQGTADGTQAIQTMTLKQAQDRQTKVDEPFELQLLIEPGDFRRSDLTWKILPEGSGSLKKEVRRLEELKLRFQFHREGVHLIRIETEEKRLLLEFEVEVYPRWRDKCPILLQEIRDKKKRKVPMKTSDAIFYRRSIRRMKEEPFSPMLLGEILRAAAAAPSAGNLHAVEYIVIEDEALRQRISQCTYFGNREDGAGPQSWIAKAPVILVVVGDPEVYCTNYGPIGERFMLLDAGAAIQNMLLRAFELGIGSCIIGGIVEEDAKRELRLPATYQMIALIALGYGDERVETNPPKARLYHHFYGEEFKSGWKLFFNGEENADGLGNDDR